MTKRTHSALLMIASSVFAFVAWVPAADAAATALFAGGNAKKNSAYFFGGGVYALNGDIGSNGFLLRGVTGYGDYSYRVGATKVDGTLWQLDASLGYQMFSDNLRFSGYAGFNHQNHKLSPVDPGNSTRGGHSGAMGQLEVETLANSPFYFGAMANYSTANHAYWTRLRLGYNLGNAVIGPEAIFDGNKEYVSTRIGGFLGFGLGDGWRLDVGAGSAHASGTQSGNGIYGSLGLSYSM